MQNHFQLTDSEFEQAFANCTLPASLFSHQAHLRLAWIHIKKYGVEKAIKNVTDQIRKYVQSLGAEDKYNETVTIAGVKAVYHFILKSSTTDFSDFIKENKELQDNFKGLLLSHYETNIFESEIAKKRFIEPELIPFD